MTVSLSPAGGPALTLIAHVNRMSPLERTALRNDRLRLAITQSPPLVWLALDAGKISLDAPYALGVEPESEALRQWLGAAARAPETLRCLAHLIVIDRGLVAISRLVSLSRAWWVTLAEACLAAPPDLDREAYMSAVARDQQSMTTRTIIERATVIEVAGAV